MKKKGFPGWIRDVRRRLGEHLREGSFEQHVTEIHRRSPAYGSQDHVARRGPCAVMPSVLLRPGHSVATRHADGRSALVHRPPRQPEAAAPDSHEGAPIVSAFLNVCRHRGAPLLPESEPPAPKKLLVCPYHAWSYRPDTGALQAIPGRRAFPCLDKSDHSLVPIPSFEMGGFIWLGDQRDTRYSMDEIHDDLEPFLLLRPPTEKDVLVGYREWNLASNWQLLVETFLESYHVFSLHQKTLSKVAHSSVMVTDIRDGGRNFRMTVPLRNLDAVSTSGVRVQTDTDETAMVHDFLGQTTTTSLLFPSTAVSLFKRFALFLSIQPTGPESSRVRAWATDHVFTGNDPEFCGTNQKRDWEAVMSALEEDWSIAEQIQSNLEHAGEMVYGQWEGLNVKFLQNVDSAGKETR